MRIKNLPEAKPDIDIAKRETSFLENRSIGSHNMLMYATLTQFPIYPDLAAKLAQVYMALVIKTGYIIILKLI